MDRFKLNSLACALFLAGGCSAAQAATFTVTSNANSGPGTLRQAIDDANAAAGADTINFASYGMGGAIDLSTHNVDSAFVLSDDVTINGPGADSLNVRRSQATGVSHFRIFQVSAGVQTTIRGLTISNGSNPGYVTRPVGPDRAKRIMIPGGGIYNAGSLTLENCVLDGNTAQGGDATRGTSYRGGEGGAIFSTGTLTITNCTFSANKAAFGGGIYGAATIVNSTFVGNRAVSLWDAKASGGALYLKGGSSITNGTFSGNNAPGGSSLFNSGGLEVSNTLFNDSGKSLLSSGTFTDGGYNLAINDGDGLLTAPTNKLKVDPLLGFLSISAGTTPTLSLMAGSPAIDAGNTSLSTDQRGLARPTGNGDDIGAFEVHASLPPVIKSLTLTPDLPFTNDPITAVTEVDDAGGKPVTLTYQWRRTRGGKTIILPETGRTLATVGDTVALGDIITLTVIANNGVFNSIPRRASVTIQNSAPKIVSLTLKPRTPYTFEKMVATIKATDPDKTRLFYTFVWTKNGVITRAVADTRSSQDFYDLNQTGNGDKGDVIKLTVTASDGEWSNVAQTDATVRNSVPVLSQLVLAPQAPAPGQFVTSSYGGRDADGDALTRIYKWAIGKTVLVEERSSRLDLAKYPAVKPGDVISLELRLSDGASLSKTVRAQVVVGAPAAQALTSPSAAAS